MHVIRAYDKNDSLAEELPVDPMITLGKLQEVFFPAIWKDPFLWNCHRVVTKEQIELLLPDNNLHCDYEYFLEYDAQ